MSSAVLDDYCWIHSTFHVRSEYQGIVGCLVDPELVVESQSRFSDPGYFLHQNNQQGSRGKLEINREIENEDIFHLSASRIRCGR